MKPVLEINALKKYYGKPANPTKALDGITFQVMAGEFLGIMGSSGSGKSTLLNCIATVIRPDSGSIIMNGASVLKLKGAALAGYRGKQIGYLFQNFELLDNLTGKENILLPLSIQNVPEKESRKRLHSLADYLEIRDVLDKFPAQMSGGQKQRVAAARAKSLMEKLSGLNQDKNTTILMVTHDTNAASYCRRILFIQDGIIFHKLRRDMETESRLDFYERILNVTAHLGGGSANVL